MQIRQLEVQDLLSLAQLFQALEQARWANEMTLEQLQEALVQGLQQAEQSRHYVAVHKTDIMGYGAVHWVPFLLLPGPEAYLTELFVHPQARGQGLGQALLAVIEDEARDRGCYRLSLLNFRQRDSYQRGFYAKADWQERPEVSNWIKVLR